MINIKIYLKNENKWIAIDKNYRRLLLSDKNLNRLQETTRKKNIGDAIIMFVPSLNTTLAPIYL